jgi:putative flippase GtrA
MAGGGGFLARTLDNLAARVPGWPQMRQIVRFYQAAIINTAFGISLYALFVWLGLNLFVAQAAAHVLGSAFNYITYSRHVFAAAKPAKLRFAMSYVGAYLLNLVVLYGLSRFIASPYIAGISTALIVSAINFVVLKRLVFRTRAA